MKQIFPFLSSTTQLCVETKKKFQKDKKQKRNFKRLEAAGIKNVLLIFCKDSAWINVIQLFCQRNRIELESNLHQFITLHI